MSIRKADVDHAWRRCRIDRDKLSIDAIEVTTQENATRLALRSRVAAIVGQNGAGKTRLLMSLHDLLTRTKPERALAERISGTYRGKPFLAETSASLLTSMPPFEFIDSALEAHRAKRFVSDQRSNFDDLLVQVDPIVYSSNVMQDFRHVCNKPYTSLRVWELDQAADFDLDSDYEDDIPIPYFQVEVGGQRYDSNTMGFGELCSCYLLWRLNRHKAPCIFFLDEPDSHLSPSSRIALLDLIAVYAHDNKHQFILASHCPDILTRMSEDEVFLIQRLDKGNPPERVSPASNKRAAMRALGLHAPCQVLILVEDVDAHEVIRQTLSRFGSGVDRSFEIEIVQGGASELIKLFQLFPKKARSVRIVPVLDGDKRAEFGSVEGLLFIPGGEDPVAETISVVRRNTLGFAKSIGVEKVRLDEALRQIEHANHHDFFGSLISSLGISMEIRSVRSAAIGIWLQDRSVRGKFKRLCGDLHGQLSSMPLDFGHS